MRNYIRHPSDIPVEIHVSAEKRFPEKKLLDVSQGGVAFASGEKLAVGTAISVCIRAVRPPFRAIGVVAWCLKRRDRYDVGVRFDGAESGFRARMVEQVCHIEHYKRQVLATEGRRLTGKQAAFEWIEKYAADFPGGGVADDLHTE